jgi:NADP-dependent 3-hydroxy acid dehydrogenase YdfG
MLTTGARDRRTSTSSHAGNPVGPTPSAAVLLGSFSTSRTASACARAEGAEVVLTGRHPERLKRAALDVDARSTAAFDANDPVALKRFFDELPDPIDHVLVTAGGPT